MARPEPNNVDYFPVWKPTKHTIRKIIGGLNKKEAFKVFRSSCSGFIKKESVRKIILIKSNNKCVLCDSINNLQVDHIISVFRCFLNEKIFECNIESNLQILCKKCNTSKTP